MFPFAFAFIGRGGGGDDVEWIRTTDANNWTVPLKRRKKWFCWPDLLWKHTWAMLSYRQAQLRAPQKKQSQFAAENPMFPIRRCIYKSSSGYDWSEWIFRSEDGIDSTLLTAIWRLITKSFVEQLVAFGVGMPSRGDSSTSNACVCNETWKWNVWCRQWASEKFDAITAWFNVGKCNRMA